MSTSILKIIKSVTKSYVASQQSLTTGYRYLGNYTRMQNRNSYRRNFSAHSSVQSGPPLPSQPPSSSMRWILGTVLALILPFAGNKWGPLLTLKQDVDTVVDTIEEIVEVVDKVAEMVDKVAENISDGLSEGGKIKKFVDIVEDVAEETAKDARIVENAIDKFQELEEKVENIVDTLGDKANEHPKETQLSIEK
ncbi:hypothetical protein OROGR_032681 [Orobanche gracilis]